MNSRLTIAAFEREIEINEAYKDLTPKQKEFLLHMIQGYDREEICQRLAIGFRTYHSHLLAIRSILGGSCNHKIIADFYARFIAEQLK